ncbi:TonB-dependent receptor [Chryseolinea lacunae]|uniref:TonB-dependent receptor n=1 Tax=Chryseolinea lacunae TaxID=2801331 RepID=A0ABS1KM75_9BACT|nr:TonB-dependent receptor [Chryseolinea lacunae]MBL0740565.1 TonB-dependent receptor [Chryseolinea lacunae]
MRRSIYTKVFLILVLMVLMAFRIMAQDVASRRITVPQKECSIQTVFTEMKGQGNIVLSYGNSLPLNRVLKFETTNVAVSTILRLIREATGFTHKIQGDKIILIPPAKKYSVSGFLRDEASGENLIGANIYTLPDFRGTTANAYGYYSLTLLSDSVTLSVSYVGYQTKRMKFFLEKDTVLNVSLTSEVLDEVVVTSDESARDITHMSTVEMSVGQLEALPRLAGEVDVMKGLQLLPGVQGGSEGSSGLYVRGGSPDQNLILLDGVPVYNVSHLFGFFSVFNSDAINHVELIKGGFPARYGGRLSSVVNITMKEGNQQELHGEGSIGLVASRLTLEGPIKKNKSSFIISGRRTFADLFVRPILRKTSDGKEDQGYYFYDVNAKFNQTINSHNRLYLSAYSGRDKTRTSTTEELFRDDVHYRRKDDYDLAWGNITTALRLNSVLTPTLFSNITATYSRFKMDTRKEIDEFTKNSKEEKHDHFKNLYTSEIRDFALKADIDYIPSLTHAIKFGGYGIAHEFSPGSLTYRVGAADTTVGSYRINAVEFGAYAEDDITVSKRLKVNLGVHYSGFHVEAKKYSSVQPRLALRYLVSDKISVKASYAQMQQYIHLLSNVGVGLPTDLWVPATSVATPEQSWQGAVGFTYNPDNTYELIVEGYYKNMTGLVEYKNGASFMNLDKDWQTKIETGNGESYGGEIFLKKKEGAWTGWLGYTLSWAYRKFENIDNGRRFPFKYDRRHDLELAVIYTWNKRIDLAFTWVYGSGYPTSLPTASYSGYHGDDHADFGYHYGYAYPSRNNFRMRAYHRLDVTLSFFKQKKWGERKWIFGLYNAYSRNNPFYLSIQEDPTGQSNSKVIQHSLFPVIPAISYTFKF